MPVSTTTTISPTLQSAPSTLLVACLCARWCRTCDEYKPLFARLEADYPQAKLRWVDIEDEADLVDPIEVDNFPTLLIATNGQARFFGFITPHLETLRRLIQAQLTMTDAIAQPTEVQDLVQRLQTQAA